MSEPTLPYLEIGAPRGEAKMCVILMHGLGADGNDFASFAEALCKVAEARKWRFVLPHAPAQKVTINMGMEMPAWYDIIDFEHPRNVNWDTVRESQDQIEALMQEEKGAKKIILAGFSQGGAMALHVGLRNQQVVNGILVMSGYLLESESEPAPKSEKNFQLALHHGSDDPVVPVAAAERTREALIEAGYSPSMSIYEGLEHAVCNEEFNHVYEWLDYIDQNT